MSRHSSTYRGTRRNKCRGWGSLTHKRRWPNDGVQLDFFYYHPTDHYKNILVSTTRAMFEVGRHWLRKLPLKRSRTGAI